MLKTNTTLTKLNLSINNLGPADAEALAALLKTNATLTRLDLSGNKIRYCWYAALVADALNVNNTLTDIVFVHIMTSVSLLLRNSKKHMVTVSVI